MPLTVSTTLHWQIVCRISSINSWPNSQAKPPNCSAHVAGGGRVAPAGWKPAHRQPSGVSNVRGGGWVASRRSLPVLSFPVLSGSLLASHQLKASMRHNKQKAARGSFSRLQK